MDQALLTPLNTLETALNTLQTSLTQTNTYTAAPTAATTLVQADADIDHALTLLRRHQENHNRIQALRAEAETLNNNIKSIIQQCTALRHKAEDIIGRDTLNYDSDDDEPEQKQIDYDTLLSFATRIARENAVAAQEAENAFIRRKFDGQPQSNGVNDRPASSAGEALRTQEASVNLEQAQGQHLAMMNAKGIAFPNGERLRQGALGRLQYLFEEEGAGGVDKVVQDILQREAYGKAWEDQDVDVEDVEMEGEVPVPKVEDIKKEQVSSAAIGAAAAAGPSIPQAQQQPRPPKPPKKKLDLDFPGSDDDDDED